MPKVTKKVSVYGDSVCISQAGSLTRAQYLGAAFGAGYNDYAHGGQTLRDTIQGKVSATGANMFPGGKNFKDHIEQTDDCDICVISLGGNDAPFMRGTYSPISNFAPAEAYLGAEYLQIAADVRYLSNIAIAAGKRTVVIGMPYLDINKAVNGPFDTAQPPVSQLFATKEQAQGFAARINGTQTALRTATALWSTPFITPFGGRPEEVALQPPVSPNNTRDGIHPAPAYANAVNAYLVSRIKTELGII